MVLRRREAKGPRPVAANAEDEVRAGGVECVRVGGARTTMAFDAESFVPVGDKESWPSARVAFDAPGLNAAGLDAVNATNAAGLLSRSQGLRRTSCARP